MWFVDILRTVLIRLDLLVYTFIRIFYNLFYAISRVGINAGMADKVINNFKAVVGVYAIFKVVFVLITMMINPDEAAKSNNNIGKVAVRVVVVIALIMLVEPIFNKAFELQNAIISENLIGQIILSDEADSVVDASGYNDAGQDMANKIFAGFVNMHEDAVNEGVSLDPSDEDFNSATVLNDVSKNSCAGAFQKWLEMYNAVDTGDAKTRGISTIMGSINDKFENSDGDEKYCIQYNAGLSTVAGGLAAYMLIVYCLDIGLRIVKLVFYQLIAPIPIASYVDGKKDGPFQRWYKSCLTEYADIFIRLIIIYTVVYLIKNIGIIFDFSSLSGTGLTGLFARAIIILGMLMFAKQAPSLITQMLTGKEPTGRFGLNANEKLSKAGKVGTLIAGGIGAAGAMAAGGIGAAGSIAGGGISAVGKKVFRGEEIKGNMEKSMNNAKIKGKAASAEALSRLQTKNYGEKGKYNGNVRARDLSRQAITGNVNAASGIGGRLASAQAGIMSSLDIKTGEHKSDAMRGSGLLSTRLSYLNNSINSLQNQIQLEVQNGDNSRISKLNPIDSTTFNAKGDFDSYLKSKGITDLSFEKGMPKQYGGDYDKFVNDFMGFVNTSTFKNASIDEQRGYYDYMNKVFSDYKKQVDTLTKNK